MPFATVMFSEWGSDGFLYIQHDPDGSGGAPKSQVIHPLGFVSRPHDPPEDGNGCTVDVRRLGSERFAWLGDDPRSVAWLPRCTKGGSATYGGPLGKALTWREIDGTTGSIVDYVPVAWDANGVCTKAHKIEAGVDGNGAPVVQILHSAGMLIAMNGANVKIAGADGSTWVEVGSGSVTISGSLKASSGLDVGGTGGVPVATQPGVAAAVAAFNAIVQAATAAADGSGAAVLVALKAASAALVEALPAAATTMLKST